MSSEAGRPTPVVGILLAVCLLVYLLQISGGGDALLVWFALWPPLPPELQRHPELAGWPGFAPWQLVSYAVLHGGPLHLMLNLFGLWMFGMPVERVLGRGRFLLFFTVCVLGGALAQLLVVQFGGRPAPTIGASGGVLGLLPAFALFYPKARVQLLFPPVNLSAPVFVLVFGAAELFFGATGTLPGIAHFAHLGGMLAGAVLLVYWLFTLPRDPDRRL